MMRGTILKTNYKVVVISDTHGETRPILEVIEKEQPFDTLIHCGDVEGSLDSLLGVQPFGYVSVRGNCDWYSDAPDERCFTLGYYRIFVTHGHRYRVSDTNKVLLQEGRNQQADVILYGHTHVPEVIQDKNTGILVVNPGSLARPRQMPRKRTYAVLTLSADALPQAEIRCMYS